MLNTHAANRSQKEQTTIGRGRGKHLPLLRKPASRLSAGEIGMSKIQSDRNERLSKQDVKDLIEKL